MAAWLRLCPVLVMASVEFIMIGKIFRRRPKGSEEWKPPKVSKFLQCSNGVILGEGSIFVPLKVVSLIYLLNIYITFIAH